MEILPEHPALTGRPVYLDHNATTPVDPRVLDVIQAALTTGFGNPSSTHTYGEAPRRLLAPARAQVAALIGASAGEVVFTASGSESDALAIRGAVLARAAAVTGRPHVITQVTEHPAVLAACRYLSLWHDVDVTYLPVDRHGRVDPAEVAAAITPDTVLVTVMHAHNETGTLQPIADIAEITRLRGVLLHTDAAQSGGKVDLDIDRLGVDLLTVVGHKMYAPKGIAALYVRDGVTLEPLIGGGGQEHRCRSPSAAARRERKAPSVARLRVSVVVSFASVRLCPLTVAGAESEHGRTLAITPEHPSADLESALVRDRSTTKTGPVTCPGIRAMERDRQRGILPRRRPGSSCDRVVEGVVAGQRVSGSATLSPMLRQKIGHSRDSDSDPWGKKWLLPLHLIAETAKDQGVEVSILRWLHDHVSRDRLARTVTRWSSWRAPATSAQGERVPGGAGQLDPDGLGLGVLAQASRPFSRPIPLMR